jgi:hypothetical protein
MPQGVTEGAHEPLRSRFGLQAVLARWPELLLAGGLVLFVAIYQLRLTHGNPPGLHRDEVSIAYNAWTISQHLHDQGGAFLPVFFYSTGDYKSPTFVYLLAALFRITGPSTRAALELGAIVVFAAILLLGVLAWRRTRSVAVAAGIVVLGGLTPWLYELGRVIWETVMFPLALVTVLLALDWAYRSPRAWLWRAVPPGLALGALVYVYAEGRMLAFLFAGALLVFASRGCWRWLLATWGVFALSVVPLLVYLVRHPGFRTERWRGTTFVTPDMSVFTIAWQSAWHYAQDVSLWHWVSSGDQKPYIHSWGAGQLFGSVVVLAAIGVFVVLRVRPLDRWWLFVIVAALLSPIPASLTHNRHHALRLLTIPVFLLVLAIPGLQFLFRRVRESWLARVVVVGLAIAVVGQSVWALHWFDVRGPDRRVFFEADVPRLLDLTLREKETIYIDHDDLGALAHAWWYATAHHVPLSRVIRLPDGGIPPNGSIVFGYTQPCDYVCNEYERADESYWLAKAAGPKPPS